MATLRLGPSEAARRCPCLLVGNYTGCVRREPRYDTAHALQIKVLPSLKVRGEPLLSQQTAQYWTPHSGRNFLVSAASAVGVSKPDRDMLGGWPAQQSDRSVSLEAASCTSRNKWSQPSRIMKNQTRSAKRKLFKTSQSSWRPVCRKMRRRSAWTFWVEEHM